MSNSIKSLALLITGFGIASCSSDAITDAFTPEKSRNTTHFELSVSQNEQTRGVTEYLHDRWKYEWDDDDELVVATKDGGKVAVLSIKSYDKDGNATFASDEFPKMPEGTRLYFYYLENVDVKDGDITSELDYTQQTSNYTAESQSTSTNTRYLYGEGVLGENGVTVKSNVTMTNPFTSAMKFVISNKAESTTPTKIVITGLEAKCKLNLSTGAVTPESETDEITIKNDGNSNTLVAVLPAQVHQASDAEPVNLHVYYSDGRRFIKRLDNSNEITFAADKYYTGANHDGITVSLDKAQYVPDNNGHDYVDLGVVDKDGWPVYFATKNVGSTRYYDNGQYFAYGETQVYYTGNVTNTDPYPEGNSWNAWNYWKSGKSGGYAWSSYPYGNSKGDTGYTKVYDSDGLMSAYDAATANWGGDWRTPSREEWQYLMDQTYREYYFDGNTGTGLVGIFVFKVKEGSVAGNRDSNGMITWTKGTATYDIDKDPCIFIPAAGAFYEKGRWYANNWGVYMCRDLQSSSLMNLLWFNISNMYFNFSSTYDMRCVGVTVRPVLH